MASIKLYYALPSPVARSSLLTVDALGLEVEKIPVNLLIGEHMAPDYLKINPLSTVPSLQDGNFTLFDSHAINPYLVDKYGENDSLYPKDLQKRAIVNQRLHFDNGFLFARAAYLVDLIKKGATVIDKSMADPVNEAYRLLEILIGDNDYAAGNEITIADFSLASTISNSAVVLPIDKDSYPKITAWLKRMEALPYFKINKAGVAQFKGMIQMINPSWVP